MSRSLNAAETAGVSSDTRWITSTVALLAIIVFTISGSQVLPLVIDPGGTRGSPEPALISAFLLNIALVLFAWRRSAQLKRTFAERDAAKSQAYNLAYYDEVTGLFNRRRLNELLEEICSAKGSQAALLLVDLDHFKKINDLYGHAVGDELLSITADRLVKTCPAEATCFRLGGDEFAILLCGSHAGRAEAERLAEEFQTQVGKPVNVANTVTAIGSSIGVATLNKKCRRPRDLLRRADLAMYEAKRLGRNRHVRFTSAMETDLDRRNTLETEMRSGISSGEFVPYFQPILDLESGETRGFEVLARWKHPQRGLIEPPEFLELAETTGMISDLSFMVMHQALTIARDWPSEFKIAVNVSPVQFNDPLLAQRILKVLSATGFPPGRLELEIMEKSLLDDQPLALSIITSLKNSGISISVDDFGTGYAMLTELKELPFDRIKIDRSFMRSLTDDDRCDALVRAVSSLGKGLKLPITAEGVETDAVQAKLASLGCTDAQGWLFGKALSAEEVGLGYLSPAAARGPDPSAIGRKSA